MRGFHLIQHLNREHSCLGQNDRENSHGCFICVSWCLTEIVSIHILQVTDEIYL